MKHYKTLLDPGEYLGPQDFMSPREVTIARVERIMPLDRDGKPRINRNGKKQVDIVMWIFKKDGVTEYERKMKLPMSVLTIFGWLFGVDYELWAAQKIAFKSAWCMFGKELEPCLRPVLDGMTYGVDDAGNSMPVETKIIKWLSKRTGKRFEAARLMWECEGPK